MPRKLAGIACIGPYAIDKKKETMIAHCKKVVELTRKIDKEYDKKSINSLYKQLGKIGCDDFDAGDIVAGGHLIEPNSTDKHIKKFVEEFITFWKEGSDDSSGVAFEESNIRFIFAGDSTYGNPPDGRGYLLLETAFALGLCKKLGIQ